MSWSKPTMFGLTAGAVMLGTLIAGTTPGAAMDAATAASGSSTWQPREKVTSDGFLQGHELVVDASGHTTVVWANDRSVNAKRRAPNGTWGRTVVIGGVSSAKNALESLDLHVGVDDAGNVTAVWDQLTRDLATQDPTG